MRQALVLADQAANHRDVPVGALVVSGAGRVLGCGENSTIVNLDPTAHAEILALRTASHAFGNYRLPDAVLVVSLEPCIMCLGAIIQARLAGVVFGAPDSKAGCLTSKMAGNALAWSNHQFWILGGVLEEACGAKLSGFFQKRRAEKKISRHLAER